MMATAAAAGAAARRVLAVTRLDTDPDRGPVRTFYALAVIHPDSRTFDITLSDAHNAWSARGCQGFHATWGDEQRWERTLEALNDEDDGEDDGGDDGACNDGGGGADMSGCWRSGGGGNGHARAGRRFWVTEERAIPGSLRLTWSWPRAAGPGADLLVVRNAALMPEPDPGAAVAAMMDVMLASYAEGRRAMRRAARAQGALRAELADLSTQLRAQSEATKAREHELYLRFSMLLNAKTRALQQRDAMLQQALAQVEELRRGGGGVGGGRAEEGEGEDVDTDDERAEREALRAATDADTDEDDDGDGGGGGREEGRGGDGGGGHAASAAGRGQQQQQQQQELELADGAAAGRDDLAFETQHQSDKLQAIEERLQQQEEAAAELPLRERLQQLGRQQQAAAAAAPAAGGAQPMDVDGGGGAGLGPGSVQAAETAAAAVSAAAASAAAGHVGNGGGSVQQPAEPPLPQPPPPPPPDDGGGGGGGGGASLDGDVPVVARARRRVRG